MFMLLFVSFFALICVHMCVSHSVPPVSFSHSLPLSVSLPSSPSPASSVKWWTCSPHAVCHCHPSLQSWRWQGWPGCVWSGRGPLALQKKMTSTTFWRWKRKARYVFFFLFFLRQSFEIEAHIWRSGICNKCFLLNIYFLLYVRCLLQLIGH